MTVPSKWSALPRHSTSNGADFNRLFVQGLYASQGSSPLRHGPHKRSILTVGHVVVALVLITLLSLQLTGYNNVEALQKLFSRLKFGDAKIANQWGPNSWGPEQQSSFLSNLKNCSGDSEQVVRDYFKDIVLIINNNYENYAANTTDFWRSYYGSNFAAVVVISANGVPSLDIEAAWELYPDAPNPWWGTWMFHFWALKRIMQRYDQAAGFLWTNDDVIINYWNLVGADKTKLWLPNSKDKYEYQHFVLDPTPEEANQTWGNWASRIQFRRQIKLAMSLLETRFLEQYNQSMLPLGNVYHKRGCDLFYIPQRHVQSIVQHVLPAIQGGHVVSELAIPFIFFALDSPDNFSHVLDDMVYRWDFWRPGSGPFQAKDHWSGNISAFHPWKLSLPQARKEMVTAMSTFDGCLPKRLPGLFS